MVIVEEKHSKTFRDSGLSVFTHTESPFSDHEWNELKRIIPIDPGSYEYVKTGDTLESTTAGVFAIAKRRQSANGGFAHACAAGA